MFILSLILLQIAAITSRIGMASIVTGKIRDIPDSGKVAMGKIARIKPRNRLPESPIKIFAGGKLKNRYPNSDPTRMKQIIEENNCPCRRNTIPNIMDAIMLMPDDNPSRPSIRLMELVIPIIQSSVIGILK